MRQADWRSDRWASSCITGMDMKGSPVPGPILIRLHWSELLFINHALSTEVCAAFIGYLVSSLLSFTATTALFCLRWTRHYSRYNGPFLYRCKSCHIQWDVCIEDAEGLGIHIHSFFSKGKKTYYKESDTKCSDSRLDICLRLYCPLEPWQWTTQPSPLLNFTQPRNLVQPGCD